MQTRDKILYYVIGLIVLVSISLGIYRYAIAKDMLIEQDVWCDAEAGEQCFYDVCLNDWWWPCTGDPADDIWVYKRVTKPYASIGEDVFPTPCIPGETIGEDEFCPEIACEEGEEGCTVLYCDPVTDDNCYLGENVARAEEEWLTRLAEAGIEPVAEEEGGGDVLDESGDDEISEGSEEELTEEQ